MQLDRVLLLIAFMLGTMLPQSAFAAEPAEGVKTLFRDPYIEQLAGDWKLTRKIRGKEAQNTLKAEWVLNHQFLQLHMKDVADPPQYEAIVLIGYQHENKQYVVHWLDVWGGKFSAMGHGKRVGDALEIEFHYPDGPFYNTFVWNAKDQSWTFTMEGVKDGKRVPFAVDTLRRN
ncbi:MAG: DUF1579 family protein [Betaproteobacteria bacterium]|nr:DUF1579 family protein [Betaproteobacteria bacterium]